VNHVDANWTGGKKNGKKNGKGPKGKTLSTNEANEEEITIVLSNGNDRKECFLKRSTCLGNLFNSYAEECGVPLKSLRFVFHGRTLFLSSVGKRTAKDLNMRDMDEISVTSIQDSTSEVTPNSAKPATEQSSKSKKRHANKKAQRKKAGKPTKSSVRINEAEEKAKEDHSIALSRIFEEAEPVFKAIRQKLHNLTLDRKSPKIRRSSTDRKTETSPTSAVFNPNTFGLGGKAGKTSYTVNVGRIENLYISSKRSPICCKRDFIDLHGCTKDQAIQRLDVALIDWVKTAMEGEYPWVMPVDIICGGGSQILSETVEGWIKEKKNVANAPKSQ
jgi:DNA-nicking Smr family endonuclease